MGLAEIAAEIKAQRVADRSQRLASWAPILEAALREASTVRQVDVRAAANTQDLPERLAWVSLNHVMPAGGLEAWVDTEGVLDIEVPRDLVDDLAAHAAAAGLRVGTEIIASRERAVLHVNFVRAGE